MNPDVDSWVVGITASVSEPCHTLCEFRSEGLESLVEFLVDLLGVVERLLAASAGKRPSIR